MIERNDFIFIFGNTWLEVGSRPIVRSSNQKLQTLYFREP